MSWFKTKTECEHCNELREELSWQKSLTNDYSNAIDRLRSIEAKIRRRMELFHSCPESLKLRILNEIEYFEREIEAEKNGT